MNINNSSMKFIFLLAFLLNCINSSVTAPKKRSLFLKNILNGLSNILKDIFNKDAKANNSDPIIGPTPTDSSTPSTDDSFNFAITPMDLAKNLDISRNTIIFFKDYHCEQKLPCYCPLEKYNYSSKEELEKILTIQESEVSSNKYLGFRINNNEVIIRSNIDSRLGYLNEELKEMLEKYLPYNTGNLNENKIEKHTKKIMWGIEDTSKLTNGFAPFTENIVSFKLRISDPFNDSQIQKKVDLILEEIRSKSNLKMCIFEYDHEKIFDLKQCNESGLLASIFPQ